MGLAANVILAALKTSIGVVGNSPALLADGINSTSDVAYGIVMSVFMRLSVKPADHDHPYGHHQMESISAVVVGAFVITTAIAIFWNTVNGVYDLVVNSIGTADGASVIALWVAVFTLGLKCVLYFWTRRIGEQTRNPAIAALASDHRNDIFSAMAAGVGIFFGRMGYPWIDPLAGALVSLIILKTGIEIIRSSADDLMDTIPGKALGVTIRSCVCPIRGVRQVEEIHAHRFGPYMVVNLTIGVDGELTVAQGDSIATRVEESLLEGVDFVKKVHVHYHPVSHPDQITPCEP
ncbi:MAG: cation diffusion facilitator family transporter [Pseudomonadota bacterium]